MATLQFRIELFVRLRSRVAQLRLATVFSSRRVSNVPNVSGEKTKRSVNEPTSTSLSLFFRIVLSVLIVASSKCSVTSYQNVEIGCSKEMPEFFFSYF